jgi:hypothetical protein
MTSFLGGEIRLATGQLHALEMVILQGPHAIGRAWRFPCAVAPRAALCGSLRSFGEAMGAAYFSEATLPSFTTSPRLIAS